MPNSVLWKHNDLKCLLVTPNKPSTRYRISCVSTSASDFGSHRTDILPGRRKTSSFCGAGLLLLTLDIFPPLLGIAQVAIQIICRQLSTVIYTRSKVLRVRGFFFWKLGQRCGKLTLPHS